MLKYKWISFLVEQSTPAYRHTLLVVQRYSFIIRQNRVVGGRKTTFPLDLFILLTISAKTIRWSIRCKRFRLSMAFHKGLRRNPT